MQKKPLLFIIPLFIILVILFIVDEPIQEEADGSQTEMNYLTLKLAVGKTGNLEGGFEPVYSKPDESSEAIAKLEFNCTVLVVSEEKDWICVDLKGKGTGYVKKTGAEICDVSFGSADYTRMSLILDAYSHLGLKFVRYGKSLTEGIDCSNFTSQMYAAQGMKISVWPTEQRDQGRVIPEASMQPGDIIYYDKANNGTGHVGMYLGDGFIINSSGHSGKTYPEGGVRIVRLLYPNRTSYQVVRYIGETVQDNEEDSND